MQLVFHVDQGPDSLLKEECKGHENHFSLFPQNFVQSTTVIVEIVLVETTVLVEQKPLTTQFYLLLVESPL